MPYAWPARAAAKPAIRNQSNRLSQAHPRYSGSRRQHLPHARAALRSLIPDDNNVSGTNVPGQDRLHRSFLRFKYLRVTIKLHHAFTDSRLFDNSTIRRKITPQYGNTPFLMICLIQRSYNVFILNLCRVSYGKNTLNTYSA